MPLVFDFELAAAVPERLRHLLDSRLPEVLRIRDPADEIATKR